MIQLLNYALGHGFLLFSCFHLSKKIWKIFINKLNFPAKKYLSKLLPSPTYDLLCVKVLKKNPRTCQNLLCSQTGCFYDAKFKGELWKLKGEKYSERFAIIQSIHLSGKLSPLCSISNFQLFVSKHQMYVPADQETETHTVNWIMKGKGFAFAHENVFLRKITLSTEAVGCWQLPAMLLIVAHLRIHC